MKSQLIIASVIVCFAFSSCKKCLTCYGSFGTSNKKEICSGTSEYESYKSRGFIHDDNNNDIKCN